MATDVAEASTTRLIGSPVKRVEDPRLMTGAARYLDDLVLPGMSGTALVERITAERPGLRFLYTSGYVDETLRGAGHVLEKPFTPEDLLLKVHDLLR